MGCGENGRSPLRTIYESENRILSRLERKRTRNMSSTSPAHSSVSTTAVVGGGGGSGSTAAFEDFHFPSDLISIQDRKEEAMLVLKADLMAALNKEVKSLDEDSWKFEGPRSRIHLISRPGGFMNKKMEITKSRSSAPPKQI